ncbi:hypothetical protein ACLB2K_053930 [Fragaria x ananassa]
MLKQDGVVCSCSPCIEQVQRATETLRSKITDIQTFEILFVTYEVREGKMESFQVEERWFCWDIYHVGGGSDQVREVMSRKLQVLP